MIIRSDVSLDPFENSSFRIFDAPRVISQVRLTPDLVSVTHLDLCLFLLVEELHVVYVQLLSRLLFPPLNFFRLLPLIFKLNEGL